MITSSPQNDKHAIPRHLITSTNIPSTTQTIHLDAAPPLYGPVIRNTSELNESPHNDALNVLANPSNTITSQMNNQPSKHTPNPCIITLSFELAARSPYLLIDDEKQEVHYDLDEKSIKQLHARIRPVPFASFSFEHPEEITLSQLRTLINESINQSNNQTLARFTSRGILTPHQSVALQTSHFFFLLPTQSRNAAFQQSVPIVQTQEDMFHLNQFHQSISLRVYQTITKPVLSTAHSRVRSISNVKTPEQSISRSMKQSVNTEEWSPLHKHVYEGLLSPTNQTTQPSSNQPSNQSIQNVPDGLSYSRLASINQLPPASSQRRRNSFDMNDQHAIDSLTRHIRPSNQSNAPFDHQSINQSNPVSVRRIASLDQSIYHSHGLRAPTPGRSMPSRDSTLRQLSAPIFEGEAMDQLADRAINRSRTQSRTAAIDEDEEDGEISPLEFPQFTPKLKPTSVTFSPNTQQSHRTQSLPHSGKTTPTRAMAIKRANKQLQEDESTMQFLSSSMPHNLTALLRKDFSPHLTSQSPRSRSTNQSVPSTQASRGNERHAYYNSMDEQSPLVKRRGMKSAAQLKLDLNKSIDQSAAQITNAKKDKKPVTPAQTPRKPKYERSKSVSGSEVELSEHSTRSNSEYAATATMPADMRAEFVNRLAAMRNPPVPQEGGDSPLHFSEMLNEFSKSSVLLRTDQRNYQIVVIGERDLSIKENTSPRSILESINQPTEPANHQPKHRKNILSEFGAQTTRVQHHPVYDFNQQSKLDANDRVWTFSDVNTFLASRQDERYDPEKKLARTQSIPPSLSLPPLWIAVEDAPASVIQAIGQHFGLHPLTIEDCQSRGIREKLEVFPEYLFIVFHALDIQADASIKSIDQTINEFASGPPPLPRRASMAERILARSPFRSPATSTSRSDPRSVADAEFQRAINPGNQKIRTELDLANSTPVKVIIFPSCVLTFHRGGLKSVSKVRRQLSNLYLNRLDNTAWVVHALLDTITDSLIPVVGRTCRIADALEDNIYQPPRGSADSKKALLRQMNLMGRRLAFLRQRMWSKRDILMSLIEKDWAGFLKGVKIPYLRDVYDHVETMLHRIDASIEVVDTIQSTYLSMVNIEVSVQAENVNAAMKKMSAAATVILPLTLVSAIMGMNIFIPYQGRDNLADPSMYPPSADILMPFIVLMILMVAFGVGMYVYFKKIRYI